jgi:hypothetical protein
MALAGASATAATALGYYQPDVARRWDSSSMP